MKLSTFELSEAVNTIKTAILQGQYNAVQEVNRTQLIVYFSIGKYISAHTRKGVWGSSALESISIQLRKELPGLRGYSATNLKNMRLFYEAWKCLDVNSSVVTDEFTSIDIYNTLHIPLSKDFPIEDFFKVPFTHHIEINKISNFKTRYYYIHRTAEEHLSVDKLKSMIHHEVHTQCMIMPNNFQQTIPNAATMRKAVTMFKDEYLLDFINVEEIGVREKIDVDERLIEQQIIQNIKEFILTFGHDFAYIGNQYHLEIYSVEHFPDLLFFNRELNALVVIELKTGEFKSSYLGQLMSYLSILDAKVKKAHENPTIGIVLCKSANREYVEFVIRDYHKPMGVATYNTSDDLPESVRKAMPNMDDLKRILNK